MAEKDDISKRILETRKQTEELKAQLQSLINTGKNIVDSGFHSGISGLVHSPNDTSNENVKTSPNKVQILKSFNINHSNHVNKQTTSKNPPSNKSEADVKESPKKVRNYNRDEAREYIKKQREKRLQQTKIQETEKLKAELQKKKLQELHKKSKELVSKNLQAKRERSKSRDRNIYLRPDESTMNPQRLRPLSKDREDGNRVTHKTNTSSNVNLGPRNPNLLYPPLPEYVQRHKKIETEKGKSKDIEIVRESGNKSEKENNSPVKIITSKKLDNNPNHKALKPTNLFTSNGDDNEDTDSAGEQKRNDIKVLSNITICSPKEQLSKLQVMDHEQERSTNISHKNSAGLIDTEKKTRETQTNGLAKECPNWLQEQPAQGYPYNFINTVKRQLQFVTNSPKPPVDKAIQSSLIDEKISLQNQERVRTKQQLKDIIQVSASKESDLKSFMSHKCLNLDPRKIDHLELVTKGSTVNNFNSQNIVQSELKTSTDMSEPESESDTSKNIPEISSESGTSLKNNAESVRNLNSDMNLAINTDKLNNMKLVSHAIKSATTTLPSDFEKTPTKTSQTKYTIPKTGEILPSIRKVKETVDSSLSVDDDYETDFHTDLSRSRESIISSNSPTYNRQIILLNRDNIPTNNSKNKLLESESKETISSESTTTVSKELYSQNIPIAKSTPREDLIVEEVPSKNVENSTRSTEKHSMNIPNTISTRGSGTMNGTEVSVNNELKTSKSSLAFNSLLTEIHPSRTISENLSKSDSNLMWVNTRRGSRKSPEVEQLKKPSVSLTSKEQPTVEDENKSRNMLIKNISLRSNKTETAAVLNTTNELHLKFEAEIHLLNDFNASLQQLAAVEKALETLKSNNDLTTSKILQNRDTQTSVRTKSSVPTEISDRSTSEKPVSEVATVNYSRGSFIDSVIEEDVNDVLGDSILRPENDSALSTGLNLSTLTQSKNISLRTSENENFENLQTNNFAGMSLNMFEQLIKDEDARLENLKAILKIREQVLLDRTKGELAWLEIQRKHFKETGQLHEASAIKKKQRGILVNHQKEKHEMQRLKQMQKAASVERKIVLKEQRNMIRQQLSTDNMLKKMKVNTPRERRQYGPLKVIQRHSESIRSETSVSKRSSNDQDRGHEVLSITSRHSSVSRLSEISAELSLMKDVVPETEPTHQLSHVKRTLLMREAALKKRKKAAEDLLQWHEKLLEEEKRIAELESTANTIISQRPSISSLGEKYRFKGKQLNQLWYNLTGCESKKFLEDKIYPMSQIALERFCKNAREYSTKPTDKLVKETSDTETKNSVGDNIPELEETTSSIKTESNKNDYASDFDVESVLSNEEVEIMDQSINQLITNFSKIKEDISAFSSKQSKKSDEDIDESINCDKTDSEIEISVIETRKDTTEKNKSHESESQLISSVNTEENSSRVLTNQEHNANTEIATISPDKTSHIDENSSIDEAIESSQNHTSINIHNSVVENLNDSKEILLMLGHSETQNGLSPTEDILSKLNRVINDSEPQSSQVESNLSSSEKEQLGREVRNSLSATENILSKLSQVISEVQERRSSEDSTNLSTQEKVEDIRTDQSTEEEERSIQSSGVKLSPTFPSLFSSEKEDVGTADGTERNSDVISAKVSAELSAKEIESSKVISLVSEEIKEEVNTDKDPKELTEVASSPLQENKDSSEERIYTSIATSLLSEKIEQIDTVEVAEKLPSCVTSLSSKVVDTDVNFEGIKLPKSEEIDTGLPSQKKCAIEDSLNIHNFSENLTISPDEEDLDETENTSSESLEQLLKISKAATVSGFEEKVSIIDDHSSQNSSSEELVGGSAVGQVEPPEKYSSDESIKETNIDEDLSTDIEPKTDQLSCVEDKEVHEKSNNSHAYEIPSAEDGPVIVEADEMSPKILSSSDTELSENLHLDLSYGIIDRVEKTASNESESHVSKEDVNLYEEKEQDSLSSSTTSTSPSDKPGLIDKERSSSSEEKSPKSGSIDVKKRVSEILADANQPSRGDKSPRMQDLYVTTYDLISPANSPEAVSPTDERNFINNIFGNEAEEILRKQLAIEQEIKAITEQQQKEQQIPHLYVREIPNKPPPPYTPPSSLPPVNYPTIVPTVQEIEEITKYSAKILYKAYVSKNLENICISENTLSLITKNVTKECYKFVFDLCKDISKEHYKQFNEEKRPSWLIPSKKLQLTIVRPLDANGLEAFLNKKLKELFSYEKPNKRENTIIKWSRKKRDHVDEILVMESQAEEVQWTNYDKEELIVMDQVTSEILNMLMKDTGEALKACFEMG